MFFAKIPRHTRQNAITEGDLECILTRNCEGTEQLRNRIIYRQKNDRNLCRSFLCLLSLYGFYVNGCKLHFDS